MTRPHLRLRHGLEATGESTAAFARRIDRHRTYVSHLLADRIRPSLPVAVRIERATRDWPGGPIAAADWVDDEAEAA